jgi:hypothetical protein
MALLESSSIIDNRQIALLEKQAAAEDVQHLKHEVDRLLAIRAVLIPELIQQVRMGCPPAIEHLQGLDEFLSH